MLRKITLKNFMSHSNSVFVLADGLNVLTGPNNCGKSAVISALQMLAELPTKEGDYMVRHGEKGGCQIIVETVEGDEICWGRSGAAPYLEINGERHFRLSNDRDHYLAKLQPLLRLPPVPGGKGREDFNVHFATQKQPLFLIDQPASRAATFFASSSEAGRLVEMRAKFKDQVKEKSAQCKQRKSDHAKLKEQLAHLEPLDAYAPLLEELSKSFKQLTAQEESILDKTAMVRQIRSATATLDQLSARHEVFKEVAPPPQLAQDTPLDQLCHELRVTSGNVGLLAQQAATLAPIRIPPVLQDERPLAQLIEMIRRCEAEGLTLRHQNGHLEGLQPLPALEDSSQLAGLVRALGEASAEFERCRSKADQAQEELARFISENPTCPTCLGPWKVEHPAPCEAYV